MAGLLFSKQGAACRHQNACAPIWTYGAQSPAGNTQYQSAIAIRKLSLDNSAGTVIDIHEPAIEDFIHPSFTR
jgi:hypothetical protein